jgi:hypothetical protein
MPDLNDPKFDSEGDLSSDDDSDDDFGNVHDSAYMRTATPMPKAGVRSPVETYLHEASICGREGPPLTPRASPMNVTAADHCVVPLFCVDHGDYMTPPVFVEHCFGKEYLEECLERMGSVYAAGVKYSQWKPGLQLANGIGISCANISKSNGKYSPDHHEKCKAEPCINQIASTGTAIMQCYTHRQTPNKYNHLSLASYFFNFSSELVDLFGSFYKTRGKWRKAIRPRAILIDWMLLSWIYLEQEVNEKQERPLRFPMMAAAGCAPKLSGNKTGTPAKKAILDKSPKTPGSNKTKRKSSGVMEIGAATPKGKPGGGKPNGSGGKGDKSVDNKKAKSAELADAAINAALTLSPTSAKKALQGIMKRKE